MGKLWDWLGRGGATGLWSVCFVLLAGMLIGSVIYVAMNVLLEETPPLRTLRRRAERRGRPRI